MSRLLALATALVACVASATTVSWTRETSLPLVPNARQVAACADGRVYVVESVSGVARIRLLNGASPGLLPTSFGLTDSISCVNNRLHVYRVGLRALHRNDGSDRGAVTELVGVLPEGTTRAVGGLVVALFIPVPTFIRQTATGALSTSTTPDDVDSWRPMGTAGGAEQVVLGGGFLEFRAYAQNFDDSLWENAGQGCDPYWRRLPDAGRPTVRAIASTGIDRLVVLDNAGAIHRGVISHERRDIVVDAADFALLNTVVAGSRLRVHGPAATFTPSGAAASLGLGPAVIPMTPASISTFIGSTTYTPNEINLTSFTLTPSRRNVLANATFEEAGIELLTSNTFFPNLNISSLRGTLTLGGQVGRCGQPQLVATAATFDGNFHGVDNFFSFVIDMMNGDIKARVQSELLTGAQTALADPSAQLAIQRMLLDVARFKTGGAAWSHIVGPTFSITGGTVRFTVER